MLHGVWMILRMKFDRYYPDHQTRKVFDDLLGFRSLCDNYEDVLELVNISELRIADMSKGKANDDGYEYTTSPNLC